jgi:hypothetical protein
VAFYYSEVDDANRFGAGLSAVQREFSGGQKADGLGGSRFDVFAA